MLTFLLQFTLMVLLGSMLCIGWYVVTRGYWYKTPDDKFKTDGMIFKWWSLFWEQFPKEKEVFYKGDILNDKWNLLKKVRPDLCAKYRRSMLHEHTFQSILENRIEEKDLEAIKDALACEVRWDASNYFRLYQIEPVYRFPWWIRKPVSECPICYSSIYGSLFYWFIVYQVPGLFSWSSKEFLAKLGFWFIFCVILSGLNNYISQKMKL